MKTSAVISSCKQYRYELRRVWDGAKPFVLFIGLNPSTADENNDDNTSRVCVNYAKRWDYGGLLIGNLFGYRSRDKEALRQVPDPVGPENDVWLRKLQSEADLVVCAWTKAGAFMGRSQRVLSLLKEPCCLIQLRDGYPGHPLYKRADLKPTPLKTQSSLS